MLAHILKSMTLNQISRSSKFSPLLRLVKPVKAWYHKRVGMFFFYAEEMIEHEQNEA